MKYFLITSLLLHTLWCFAQTNDTIPKTNFKRDRNRPFRQLYVPSVFIIGGIVSEVNFRRSLNFELHKERNNDIPYFKTRADDYLQYSPILLAYGFDAMGLPSKTDFINRSVILLKSELIMSAAVTGLKYTIRELRPDSSARTSVPSGHTAQAFAAAAFFSEEYGKRYKWAPYLSYTLASTVGVLRIMNNKHYLSDVLIGAGIGILSTKISYWTHQYKWGKGKTNVQKL